jgi:hypothetical protein
LAERSLLPYQRPAWAYAKDRARIALFMQMRLGKTIVALRWARHRKLRRVLLIAPQPTLVGEDMWEGELRGAGFPVTLLHTAPKEDREARARWKWVGKAIPVVKDDGFARPGDVYPGLARTRALGWFCLNPEALVLTPEVLDLPWDGIVVDESTRIRNPKARITKLLTRHAGHVQHRAILSGEPSPEDDLDLFEQFNFLLGEFCGWTNYWAFRHRFFYQGFADYDWRPKKGTKDMIRAFVHEHAFFLSRKTAGVGSVKIYERRTVPMNALQERATQQIATKMAFETSETKWAPVAHQWMRTVAGGFSPESKELMSDAKPRALRELVTEEFKGKSVVVWFAYNHEIDYCFEILSRVRGLSVEYCHGAVSKKERPKIQARFQAGTTRVLLIQEALGQFGWRLDRANVEIYYSNNYEFEDRSQSEDRLIHPKKTDPERVIDLVTLGTADEDVVDTLREKKLNARSITFTRLLTARLNERLMRMRPGDAM